MQQTCEEERRARAPRVRRERRAAGASRRSRCRSSSSSRSRSSSRVVWAAQRAAGRLSTCAPEWTAELGCIRTKPSSGTQSGSQRKNLKVVRSHKSAEGDERKFALGAATPHVKSDAERDDSCCGDVFEQCRSRPPATRFRPLSVYMSVYQHTYNMPRHPTRGAYGYAVPYSQSCSQCTACAMPVHARGRVRAR